MNVHEQRGRSQMNDSILLFRRYEDSSLEYIGVNRHSDEEYIGVFDSRIKKKDDSRYVIGR